MELDIIFQKYCKPEEFKKLFRFGITGVVNTLVDTLVFVLLGNVFGVRLDIAQGCAYAAGTLNSYLMNRKWTFRTKQRVISMQMVKFIISNLIVMRISVLLLMMFVQLSMPLPWAKLATICITTMLNFCISRLWIFR